MFHEIGRRTITAVLLFCSAAGPLRAQDIDFSKLIERGVPTPAGAARKDQTSANVLSPSEWQRVDASVGRALTWLAAQQQPDGSFPTLDHGQSGVTSLCVLAFMAHGYNPGDGEYAERLSRAVNYIMSCQKDSGLISMSAPNGPLIIRDVPHPIGSASAYNHAISSLTLCEMYGMGDAERAEQVRKVIDKSLVASLAMQRWPKDRLYDQGGWRYINDYDESDSDLSITGWELMFLRSARNAGFDVPNEAIDGAIGYVRRTFDKNYGTFVYKINRGDQRCRAMAGAGILALGHAGFHNSPEAQRTGKWLLQYSFDVYNHNQGLERDRYHYSLFNCCQGMYQLGSPYWEQFFPRTVRAVLANQQADGSWDAENYQVDRQFGTCYTTALVILSLGAPNQLLPVFQR